MLYIELYIVYILCNMYYIYVCVCVSLSLSLSLKIFLLFQCNLGFTLVGTVYFWLPVFIPFQKYEQWVQQTPILPFKTMHKI